MLDAAERLATDFLASSPRPGDTNEPWLDDAQKVQVDPKVRGVINGLVDSGLFGAVFDAFGAPQVAGEALYQPARCLTHGGFPRR